MLVEDVVPVPVPGAVARARLLALGRGGAVRGAAVGGFRARAAVLAGAGLAGLPERIEVRTAAAFRRGPGVIIPVRWVLSGASEELAPPLDADLELDPNPDGTCRLILRGSYRLPVGRLGGTLDWLLLCRVARATTRGFLTRLCRAIQQLPAPGRAPAVAAGVNRGRGGDPLVPVDTVGRRGPPDRVVDPVLQRPEGLPNPALTDDHATATAAQAATRLPDMLQPVQRAIGPAPAVPPVPAWRRWQR